MIFAFPCCLETEFISPTSPRHLHLLHPRSLSSLSSRLFTSSSPAPWKNNPLTAPHLSSGEIPVSHRALLCVPKYCGCFWRSFKTTSAARHTQSSGVLCLNYEDDCVTLLLYL